MTTEIHLIRHGHVFNPDGIIYGRLPGFRLSELGRKQVAQTAISASELNLSTVYVSPMLRAQETADILFAQLPSIQRVTHEAINEVPFELEGCTLDAAEARNWDLYTGAPPQFPQPTEVAARVISFIDELLVNHSNESVALVSHGDVIVFTVLWALNVPLIPENKHILDQHGLSDPYPALASVTSLNFLNNSTDMFPKVSYHRPYGEDLVDKGVAPK